jgi:hypothetical protein
MPETAETISFGARMRMQYPAVQAPQVAPAEAMLAAEATSPP